MRPEGISVLGGGDVRDGSAAQISLLYLVIETRDKAGQETGFAASSCLHVAQTVSVPRLRLAGRPTYAVVPTWRSCGILVGDTQSYSDTILRNADEQIARFLTAWRAVNRPVQHHPGRPLPSWGSSRSVSKTLKRPGGCTGRGGHCGRLSRTFSFTLQQVPNDSSNCRSLGRRRQV